MNAPFERDKAAGSTLIVALVLALGVVLATGVVTSMGLGDVRSQRQISDATRAKALSEAGANKAYSILATNFSLRTNAAAFPPETMNGGGFAVSVSPIGSNGVVIASTGFYGTAIARAVCGAKNYPKVIAGPTNAPPVAYAYAILANGPVNISGSGNFSVGTNGLIHSNNDFNKGGSGSFTARTMSFCGKAGLNGSWTINGSLKAGDCVGISGSGTITKDVQTRNALTCNGSFKIMGNATCFTYSKTGSGGAQGTVTTGVHLPVAAVTLPDVDLTAYYNWALANGQVYNGDKSISGSSAVAPAGGIMWVNGRLSISGSGSLIGCFIATGDISISGSGSQIKVGSFPALVSRDGNIDISGSQSFHGLVYAKTGNFSKSGSGLLTGSIMCNGAFTASGSWSAFCYEDSAPAPPGTSDSSSTNVDQVVVVAWQG